MSIRVVVFKAVVFVFVCGVMVSAGQGDQNNPFVIKLAIPAPRDSAGGIIVEYVDTDS